MEHTINLAAGHFLMAVSPTSSQKLLKKIKAALRKSELDGSVIDFDALDTSLEGVEECEDDDDDDVEFGVGDSIGKALALVKQVRHFFSKAHHLLNVSHRSVHHLRLVPSSLSHASKQMSPPSSSCNGCEPDGLPCTVLLHECFYFRRYVVSFMFRSS